MDLSGFQSTLFRPILVPAAILFLSAAGAMIWLAINVEPAGSGAARTETRNTQALSSLLVARHDVAAGQRLSSGDLMVRSRPVRDVPRDALQRATDAQGHVTLAPIAAGQPVLSSAITADAFAGIAARVPVGYRAYSIAVSEADIAGGFLQAGDRVDLYVTLPGALFGGAAGGFVHAADRSRSALLLQGVDILAVGTSRKRDGTADTAARTVTLALNSDALSKVALAARLGRVSFAIRNPGDRKAADKRVADLDTLLAGRQEAVAVREPRAIPAAAAITVFSGRARNRVQVP